MRNRLSSLLLLLLLLLLFDHHHRHYHCGRYNAGCTLSCICMHAAYYVITTSRIFGNNSGKP